MARRLCAAQARPSTSEQRRLVGALAVTQTVGYGVLYYAFAVLLQPIAQDLRTSAAAVTGALTVCVLITSIAGVAVGRWLDHHTGRALIHRAYWPVGWPRG